jgi:hypothetical protein
MGEDRANIWKATLPQEQAESVRDMLVMPDDKLVDADIAAVRRDYTPPADKTLPIKNVVVILMESFAGHSVGAWARRATSRRTSTSCPRKACCSTASSPTAPIPTRACSPPWRASRTCRVSNT